MDARRGARRPRGRDRLAAVRARTARVRLARAHGRRPQPPRGRQDRRAAAASAGVRGAGARPPRAGALRRIRRRSCRRSTARCASSRRPARAARSSSSAEEILDLLRCGTPPDAIAIVCPSVERCRAPLETVFGALGDPVRDRRQRDARPHAVRPRAPRPAPLRLARRDAPRISSASCARAYSGLPRVRDGLRRGPAARARGDAIRPGSRRRP